MIFARCGSSCGVERTVLGRRQSESDDVQEDTDAVVLLLDYIFAQLHQRSNFDQAQGLLALVLRVHGDRIAAVPELSAMARTLHAALADSWSVLDEDLQAVKCMVALFGQMQM